MSEPGRAFAVPTRVLVGSAILALALSVASPGMSQTLSNSFEGLSGSSKEPIDIESDLLVVHDKKKLATFKGNVKAVQGTTTLRAQELDVHYVGGDRLGTGRGAEGAAPTPASDGPDAKGKPDDNTQISKIEAKGEVVIVTDDDQTTTSDWALYDVPAQLVTVGGNVVLTQGDNVLKGDRLVIDLKTGESRFENTGNTATGGRIRALFMPKGGAAKDSLPQGAEPSAEAPTAAKPAGNAASTPGSGMADDELPLALDPLRR
jgi:lipopolysaccharide export system protein LptA